ncbi:AMP-dependent synthetase/ligase [Bifidobacterium longum]|uniref:Acyl-CoA synthetase n=2 Tax=Bifidobacterium longum subsp. infantis TaxID=1682 RepID=A0ABP1X879_BIFLI|nr:AMP-dependent synthetase/ligase [Bifidobacterium longum]ACJ51547.1 AMP-dependent synthetase and ligase [Bifidobacterium longum subsp. infantis ATCC 15697 = JCM 1222 = DSM 20088]MBX4248473.1 AMP-dependent synthetase/ligase [Bifidobacterium longum subsp. infantis]MEE4090893.1 AMP-dependent synthetase/ligase [Bifidobacterium longum subsp. infantis]CEE96580.1 Long-chain-fatty-acid--CoA ligase FadD15 [Bifidobacterium longum subsp. infantis]CEE98029.1 Long-chain-fatty-acid--CoA ligase FadD15 [Bif
MLDHYTMPGESIEIRDDQTIYSLLTDRLARTGADTVIAAKKIGPGHWQNVTTGEFHERVVSAAKGLIALGIAKGDAVTIFSSTRLEWGILDFALAAVGAVSVPIYDTDSAPQAQRIMNDSAVKLAFADNRERFDRLDSVKDHCPALKQILMLEGNALGALEGLGVSVSDEELNERVATVRADDLATIVYTSGSTGNPKGAELTHKNFVSITITASQALHEVVLDDHPRLLLFLPLAHCFARFIQYASIASDDGVVGYLPDTKSLLPDLRSFEPTYLLGVPRVFEKVYNAASHKAGAGWKGRLFVKAAEAARVWSRKEQAGEQHTFAEIAERAKYETLVYRTVRGALGPKIKYVACGGAPLSLDLAHFYNGIGLPMIQGYGMTETAAPFAATRVTDNVIGTVGQPAPGSSIRISDEGELQVKGPNVFRGYHNLPEKTAEAFTADGWLRTGDLASIDDEGRITITGRIKDIIITAGGKNVSPIPLEEEIAKCPIVEHCVVVGDQRPFIGALVTLDPESLALWLPAHGLSTETPVDRLATNAAVREEIQQYVDKANATVSRAESVRKFAVLDTQFTQENKCLTPSLKVVRPAVNHVFADVIDNEIYNGKR